MKTTVSLLILNLLFNLPLRSQNIQNSFQEGETHLAINGIKHWVKINSIINSTTPIVIIHGGPGGDTYSFEKTIGPLLEEFATIIYYEQRGCGRSEASKDTSNYTIPTLINDLDGLREILGLDKISLLGYSFGAELALRYARHYPEKVDKLILESPVELSTYSKLIQMEGFYSIADSSFKKSIETIIEGNNTISDKYIQVWGKASTPIVDEFLFLNQNVAKKNRELWEESKLKSPGRRHFVRVIFESSKGDLLKSVQGLETKCLIISGIHDKNGGFHYGRDLNQILPNSELLIYRYSAHFPDMEEPEKFASDIKNFVLRE